MARLRGVSLKDLAYSVYARRVTALLKGKPRPRHVGVMCDGNRRWAKEMGYVDPNDGHRVGARRVLDLLRWCDEAGGIEIVTLDLLPSSTAAALKAAEERTVDRTGGLQVNAAVCYGGRQEIANAVRSLLQEHARAGRTLEELAEILDVEHIAEHLYTKGQPDPDLVIRTSGEQRLSGFLLWQSAHSEFYFCDMNWPEFRHVDFLRALRSYANRQRRFGT